MEMDLPVEGEVVAEVAGAQETDTLHSTCVSMVTDSAQSDVQETDVGVVVGADEETSQGNLWVPVSMETPCDSAPMHEGVVLDDHMAYHLSPAIFERTAAHSITVLLVSAGRLESAPSTVSCLEKVPAGAGAVSD